MGNKGRTQANRGTGVGVCRGIILGIAQRNGGHWRPAYRAVDTHARLAKRQTASDHRGRESDDSAGPTGIDMVAVQRSDAASDALCPDWDPRGGGGFMVGTAHRGEGVAEMATSSGSDNPDDHCSSVHLQTVRMRTGPIASYPLGKQTFPTDIPAFCHSNPNSEPSGVTLDWLAPLLTHRHHVGLAGAALDWLVPHQTSRSHCRRTGGAVDQPR